MTQTTTSLRQGSAALGQGQKFDAVSGQPFEQELRVSEVAGPPAQDQVKRGCSGPVKEALPVVLDDRHSPVHVVGVSLHCGPLVRRKT